MSTHLKVINGTTPSERLCDTCTEGMVFQGEGVGDTVICAAQHPSFRVRQKVVKCTEYKDKRDRAPSLRTMQDMAFILTEQGPLKTVGFIPSRKWREHHKDESLLPNHLPSWD